MRMKKGIIAVIVLCNIASAAEREDLWTLTFGTGDGYTDDGYKLTNYTSTSYAISGQWDIKGNTSNGYLVTTGNRRVHTQWANTGSGLTFGKNFGIELSFAIPKNFTVSHHCDNAGCVNDVYSLLLLSTADGGSDIHFGPSATDNTFHFAGALATENPGGTSLAFQEDQRYTAQLEVFNNAVTLKIDGQVVQTGALAENTTGGITQILIGGKFIGSGLHTSDWISENVYSVTAYNLTAPEPATATLSLVALAGLAARRRRQS